MGRRQELRDSSSHFFLPYSLGFELPGKVGVSDLKLYCPHPQLPSLLCPPPPATSQIPNPSSRPWCLPVAMVMGCTFLLLWQPARGF